MFHRNIHTKGTMSMNPCFKATKLLQEQLTKQPKSNFKSNGVHLSSTSIIPLGILIYIVTIVNWIVFNINLWNTIVIQI